MPRLKFILFLIVGSLALIPGEADFAWAAHASRSARGAAEPVVATGGANGTLFYIDLNDNPDEIRRAQATARERGLGWVQVPSKRYPLGKDAVEKDGVPVTPLEQALDRALGDAESAQLDLSVLIVSGHHGTGFFGKLGDISDDKMDRLFQLHPKSREQIQLMIGAGCYSGTLFQVQSWKKRFPSLRLYAGYESVAPLGDTPDSGRYMSDILEYKDRLEALKLTDGAADPAARKKQVAGLLGQMKSLREIDYAMYVYDAAGDLSATKSSGVETLDELKARCRTELVFLDQHRQEYLDFKHGVIALPESTESSPLRVFYTHARAAQYCLEEIATDATAAAAFSEGTSALSPDEALRVLFSRNVMRNGFAHYRKEFAELRARLDPALKKFNPPLAASDLLVGEDEIGRPDIRAILLRKIKQATVARDQAAGASAKALLLTTSMVQRDLFASPHPYFVPDDWVEAGASGPSPRYNVFQIYPLPPESR